MDAQDSTKGYLPLCQYTWGSVSAGLAIVDTMNFIKADVQTIVMGMAASMGTVIASSGAKGKRFMFPNAEYMIHQPMGGTGGGTNKPIWRSLQNTCLKLVIPWKKSWLKIQVSQLKKSMQMQNVITG